MSYSVESEKIQRFIIIVRYIQIAFLAVLLYGAAMLSYDLVQLIPGIQISPWSIGCTVFGGLGVIVSYFMIRSAERKVDKIIAKRKTIDA